MNLKRKLHTKPNLYLIGFMGTGKSLIGKKVAEKVGLTFIDSDREIEKQSGSSINDIFAKMGESKFRQMEKEFIQNGHPDSGCIVSCGGGLPIPEGMLQILKAKGLVFCLWASVDTIYNRISESNERPLIQTENKKEKISFILKKREASYLKADEIISTDQKSPEQVTDIITHMYSRIGN